MSRKEAFYKFINSKEENILEIGPLNFPTFTKQDFVGVSYLDIRSTDDVKKLYCGNDYLELTGIEVDVNTIVDIDYVLDGNYKNTFKNDEKFDAFVACHVIEHIPDIINFFEDISSVLKPQAKLLIAYPDKRYCFDHFRISTSFRDAYKVYKNGVENTAELAFDFALNVIPENDPTVFWQQKDLSTLLPKNSFKDAVEKYNLALLGKEMEDAHYWIFSDYEFLIFIYNMVKAKLFPFHCLEFTPTSENCQEFYIAFEYDLKVKESPETELENIKNILSKFFNSRVIDPDLNKRYENLKSENRNLYEEKQVLSGNVNLLIKEKQALSEKINLLTEEKQILIQEMSRFSDSISWKLTSPVRKILDLWNYRK